MALTTGSLTIAVSGQQVYDAGIRSRICSFTIAAATGTPGSGGVALPNKTTSAAAFGMKVKVDRIQVIEQDHNATKGVIWSYDHGNHTLICQSNATGAATVDLPFVTGQVSGQVIRAIVEGY